MARPRIQGVSRASSGRISRSRDSLKQRGLLSHDGWVVYFAKAPDRVKIGYSGATRNRIAFLSAEQREVLRVVGVVHVPSERLARALEAKMHSLFDAQRIEGEWFALSMSDVLSALSMCREVGLRTSGGLDVSDDVPILSGMAYGADHAVA